MKKLLIALLGMGITAAHADVTIFNNSLTRDTNVAYQICNQATGKDPICNAPTTIFLTSYKSTAGTHSYTIKATPKVGNSQYVQVVAAIQYPFVDTRYDKSCAADSSSEMNNFKSAIILDDMHESDKIVCSDKGTY